MAWKNGEFNFEGVNVEQAMRQISRWYDVEIIYEGGIPNITFMGGVSRSASLSTVLRALQKAGVSFTITGKKIVVRNH
jgi:transmembrane sensor